MPFFNIGVIGHWVVGNGYALLFVAMLIEGPFVTAAAAFAAALGFLNIYAVFFLSVLGNLIPDVVYYAIGFWGREKFVDTYGPYFGVTKQSIAKAKKALDKHSGKSLVAIKLIPFLSTPGLIVAGIIKMDIKKYALWSVVITVPISLFYLLIGYYSGAVYGQIVRYANIGGYLIAAAIIIVSLIIYFQKKTASQFAKKIERE
jgi:membrane protein DedA with SNARE-associated domain